MEEWSKKMFAPPTRILFIREVAFAFARKLPLLWLECVILSIYNDRINETGGV